MPTLIYGLGVIYFFVSFICTLITAVFVLWFWTRRRSGNGRLYVYTVVVGFVRLLYEAANCFTADAIVSANSVVATPALLMAVSRAQYNRCAQIVNHKNY